MHALSLRPRLRVAPLPAPPAAPPSLLRDSEEQALRTAFRERLPRRADLEAHLEGVLADVLDHPGSLVRARLVTAILLRRGVPLDRALDPAVAVEYFHTASLLFDDLPAMDDARERRGRPCPHHVHGEAATQLAALALINRGYALLWKSLADLPAARRLPAMELVETCLGVAGVLDGQSRDLHFADGPRGPAEVLEVAEGKTVSLIRLTLLLPALIAGVEDRDLKRLDSLARVWGLAYQVLDDFKDLLMDGHESGKSGGRDRLLGRPNFPLEAGETRAWSHVRVLLRAGRSVVDELRHRAPDWRLLEHVQGVLESDYARLRQLRAEEAA